VKLVHGLEHTENSPHGGLRRPLCSRGDATQHAAMKVDVSHTDQRGRQTLDPRRGWRQEASADVVPRRLRSVIRASRSLARHEAEGRANILVIEHDLATRETLARHSELLRHHR
jgi:hypothetical protein